MWPVTAFFFIGTWPVTAVFLVNVACYSVFFSECGLLHRFYWNMACYSVFFIGMWHATAVFWEYGLLRSFLLDYDFLHSFFGCGLCSYFRNVACCID